MMCKQKKFWCAVVQTLNGFIWIAIMETLIDFQG